MRSSWVISCCFGPSGKQTGALEIQRPPLLPEAVASALIVAALPASAVGKQLFVCSGLSLLVVLVAGAAHSAPGLPLLRDQAQLETEQVSMGPSQDRPHSISSTCLFSAEKL